MTKRALTKRALMKQVVELVPELKRLPKGRLELVRRAVEETARLLQQPDLEILGPEETKTFISGLVPDVGSPAHALRAYRKRQELTQAELAEKSGITQAHISEMENGKRPIGLHSAKKLAMTLKCDYRRLI